MGGNEAEVQKLDDFDIWYVFYWDSKFCSENTANMCPAAIPESEKSSNTKKFINY